MLRSTFKNNMRTCRRVHFERPDSMRYVYVQIVYGWWSWRVVRVAEVIVPTFWVGVGGWCVCVCVGIVSGVSSCTSLHKNRDSMCAYDFSYCFVSIYIDFTMFSYMSLVNYIGDDTYLTYIINVDREHIRFAEWVDWFGTIQICLLPEIRCRGIYIYIYIYFDWMSAVLQNEKT